MHDLLYKSCASRHASRMKKNHNEASRKFHNRVAAKYDAIYDDPFWEFHDRVTWNHLKPHLPKDSQAKALDLGCGTGKWGLKLLKMGYPTTFVDLSPKMLDEVQGKLNVWAEKPDLAGKAAKAKIQMADAVDLRVLPADEFDFAVGMGDVVTICSDPAKCMSEMHRVMKPGGIFVFTIDNALAALDYFIESGNLEELGQFVRTRKTHWLTHNVAEQFDVHMMTPAEAEAMIRARGFEMISRIGKVALPVRKNKMFFKEEDAIDTMVDLEMLLAKDPASIGRSSHVQYVVKKI